MANMICMAGLPGSGKTTYAKKLLEAHPDLLYFNPDTYYERINGDECDRSNTFDVWMAMFRDIHIAEQAGHSVLIDSDNLTYAQRNQWIEWFPGFDKRYLLFFDESFESCLERMSKRRRQVPIERMCEKLASWQNPLDKTETMDWIEWDMILQLPHKENKYEKLN